VITWIVRRNEKKWFLWAHYIDPHGRYMPHPGDKSFGSTEEDLYDGELHYADKHLGRLLKELANMPGADRTIIIITSDHGDGFNEHGFINHGQALYFELLHVPMIFYIPNLKPREVPGAVSPLDIVPTISDLAGIDVSDLSFEGESLVPQLFYGRDAHERIVFAETNWPKPLRAVITSSHKLIFNLKNNIYELYDLKADPKEQKNIAPRNKAPLDEMKNYLNDWLEHVYYSRDPEFNQVTTKLQDTILRGPARPKNRVEGVTFDDGRIEVVGYDVKKKTYKPNEKIAIAVYFHVVERPSDDFKLQVEAWLDVDDNGKPSKLKSGRSRAHFTAKGIFPTSRWRDGEYIRDRFKITVPKKWRGSNTIKLGLRMMKDKRNKLTPTGPTRADVPDLAILGEVGYDEPAEESEEPKKLPPPRKLERNRP
jgi:hypothetical protein